MTHRTPAELDAGLPQIRRSPRDSGTVELIVRRPSKGEREVLAVAQLDTVRGLVGDDWVDRGSRRMADGSSDLEAQLTLMNSRVAEVLAGDRDEWPKAGDQLYVDLDLGTEHLPPGTRLAVGTAVVVVSAVPHTGCASFSGRFGVDALAFVSTPEGKALRMRGVNTRIVASGVVRPGDPIRRLDGDAADAADLPG